MHSNSTIRKDQLFILVVIYTLIFSSTTVTSNINNVIYGQTETESEIDHTNSINITTNLANLQDIPMKKAQVEDIVIAYKMFGKGDPIILHNGASDGMDAWPSGLLNELASNHTVIVFDSRGIGNTTSGTEPYSIKLVANDTAALMDALKIPKASILGYSLGTFIAQQFAITHPEKVNSIIIIAGSCGGKEGIPKPQEFLNLQEVITNKTKNNVTVSTEELRGLVAGSLGSGWVKLHPESLDLPENISLQQMKPGLSPETMDNQANAGWNWEAQNWSGICQQLAKVAKPTLVITGTDDVNYMPHGNALIIAGKVPGAWLVQIKDAGHAIVDQYPEKLGKIIETFLSTAT